jgi:hypothetical protein
MRGRLLETVEGMTLPPQKSPRRRSSDDEVKHCLRGGNHSLLWTSELDSFKAPYVKSQKIKNFKYQGIKIKIFRLKNKNFSSEK